MVTAIPTTASGTAHGFAQALPRVQAAAPCDRLTHCQTCNTREVCLPAGLTLDQVGQLDNLMWHRTRVKKNEALYRPGESFHSLYAVHVGMMKTTTLFDDGREQVTGYHMPGEMIGFDGIGRDVHCEGAIALEDSEVCVLPFTRVEDLARVLPGLQRNVHRALSNELTRHHAMMVLLGSMRAEERIATFLLSMSDRYHRRGYSASEFELRMTRQDIGSYLGIKLETVSRLFSRLHQDGVIHIQGRAVKVLDLPALKAMTRRP
jgi:CRP/FNR family transcriptional regulator